MRLRKKFAIACTMVGLAWAQEPPTLPIGAAPASGKAPAIALIDAQDAAQWEGLAKERGWQVIKAAPMAAATAIDQRVVALATAVREAIQKGGLDPGRIYLGGRGEAAAAVFYTISRVPDLWAAGVALGGSLQTAVDSDRLFTANFTNVPVLWLSAGADDEGLAARLKANGLNVEWRTSTGATNATFVDWLAGHKRDEFPNEIDCETNSPSFASCYWILITKFDVNERNDVLPSTRLAAGARTALDLGGFGYKPGDPGPGLLVSYLPEKYNGPLKLNDRIVALNGRPIENARQYNELMGKATDGNAVVLVERGKEKIRVETRILTPRRDAVVTARVEAQYLPAEKQIQIVSRTVQEMRVTFPAHWVDGSTLYWNGLALEHVKVPGCMLLTVEKELLHAAKCP